MVLRSPVKGPFLMYNTTIFSHMHYCIMLNVLLLPYCPLAGLRDVQAIFVSLKFSPGEQTLYQFTPLLTIAAFCPCGVHSPVTAGRVRMQ